MKPGGLLLSLAICILTNLQSPAQPARSRNVTASSSIGLSNNPVRMFQGQVMDFSPAIRWYQSNPDATMPAGVAKDSPLRQEWERRRKAYDVEGMKWNRYLVKGTIGAKLPEGVIITGIQVTKTVQDGYQVMNKRGQTAPKYKTIHTTKEVLLKNAPENFSLPIFAFPAGGSSVGVASLEAFDYGKPVVLKPRTPQSGATLSTILATNSVTGEIETNSMTGPIKSAQAKHSSDVALLKHHQQLADKGDAYGMYRMGERYLNGNGVEQNNAMGRALLEQAAAAGSVWRQQRY